MGDNCTQVVMATAEPHTLTLKRTRSTTLLRGAKEEEGERRRREEEEEEEEEEEVREKM